MPASLLSRSLPMMIALSASWLVACSGDDGGSDTNGSGDNGSGYDGSGNNGADTAADTGVALDTSGEDTAVDDTTEADTTTASPACDDIPLVETASLGISCTQPADCGDGGQCVNDGDGAVCKQACIPDTCTDTCLSNENCGGLVETGTENPVQADVDGNGTMDNVGVCIAGMPAYQMCNTPETGQCEPGLVCVTADGAAEGDPGNCLDECNNPNFTCDTVEGHRATCGAVDFLPPHSAVTHHACAIVCTDNSGCPTGMTCTPFSQQANVSICLVRP